VGTCCGTLQELLEPIEKLRELDKNTMGTFLDNTLKRSKY
jgi:hypothetical protein